MTDIRSLEELVKFMKKLGGPVTSKKEETGNVVSLSDFRKPEKKDGYDFQSAMNSFLEKKRKAAQERDKNNKKVTRDYRLK